jgi:hypothetical protein
MSGRIIAHQQFFHDHQQHRRTKPRALLHPVHLVSSRRNERLNMDKPRTGIRTGRQHRNNALSKGNHCKLKSPICIELFLGTQYFPWRICTSIGREIIWFWRWKSSATWRWTDVHHSPVQEPYYGMYHRPLRVAKCLLFWESSWRNINQERTRANSRLSHIQNGFGSSKSKQLVVPVSMIYRVSEGLIDISKLVE